MAAGRSLCFLVIVKCACLVKAITHTGAPTSSPSGSSHLSPRNLPSSVGAINLSASLAAAALSFPPPPLPPTPLEPASPSMTPPSNDWHASLMAGDTEELHAILLQNASNDQPLGVYLTSGFPYMLDSSIEVRGRNVTIVSGVEQGRASMDANSASRFFDVLGAATLTLQGIDFVNGFNETEGGGFFVSGASTLRLIDVTCSYCKAGGAMFSSISNTRGGCILLYNESVAVLVDSTLKACEVLSNVFAPGPRAEGGALAAFGRSSVVMEGCAIQGCKATAPDVQYIVLSIMRGGGVAIGEGSAISILSSTISECHAGSGDLDSYGGGLSAYQSERVSLVDVVFESCSVDSANSYGGAVELFEVNEAVTVMRSAFLSCMSTAQNTGHGGAFFVERTSLTFLDSAFANNSVSGKHVNGGGEGGVFYLSECELSLVKVRITDSEVTGLIGDARGGVINAKIGPSTISVEDSVIMRSRCHARRNAYGGFLYLTEGPDHKISIVGSHILDSQLEADGIAEGGTFYIKISSSFQLDASISVLNRSSVLSKAEARGGFVYFLGSSENASMTFSSMCIDRGQANLSVAVGEEAQRAQGGCVYIESGRFVMNNVTTLQNCEADDGATLFIVNGVVMYVLPVPPGHWLPHVECRIYRDACPLVEVGNGEEEIDPECLERRPNCSQNLLGILDDNSTCPATTLQQPCDWRHSPELIGLRIFQFPFENVDDDLPFPCAPGLLGSSDPDFQLSPLCAGLCPMGEVCEHSGASASSPCPIGHYCPAGSSTPRPCALGTYSNVSGLARPEGCHLADRGYFAVAGATTQLPCLAGRYGDSEGLGDALCSNSCAPGHYCPVGSTNDSSHRCPRGTSNKFLGGESVEICLPCPPGSVAPKEGSTNCVACSPGTIASTEGLESCEPCQQGKYQPNPSASECLLCDVGESSAQGSSSCSICAAGYYKNDYSEEAECMECDPDDGFTCPYNATLATINVTAGYWRHSNQTVVLYECHSSNGWTPCVGGVDAGHDGDNYCAEGHAGARCKVCTSSNHYFRDSDARCHDCGNVAASVAAIISIVVAIAVLLVAGVVVLRSRWEPSNACLRSVLHFGRRVQAAWYKIGMGTKVKQFIAFYQVVAAIPTVYNISLPDDKYAGWVALLEWPSLIDTDLFLPTECYGEGYLAQLLLSSLLPWGVIFVVLLGYLIVEVWQHVRSVSPVKRISFRKLLRSALPTMLVVTFLFVTSASSRIFKTFKCDEFVYDDKNGETRSYLHDDYSLDCSSNAYSVLETVAYAFIALWPAGIPLLYTALLWASRRALRTQTSTPLVRATSFLWKDYKVHFLWWEPFELLRKLSLTGFVLLLSDSKQLGRVLLALCARCPLPAFLGSLYATLLALAAYALFP